MHPSFVVEVSKLHEITQRMKDQGMKYTLFDIIENGSKKEIEIRAIPQIHTDTDVDFGILESIESLNHLE